MKKWTPEEIKRLLQIVRSKGNPRPWGEISNQFDRTVRSCQTTWERYKNDPRYNG